MNAVQDKNYPVPMYKPELPVNDKANAGPMVVGQVVPTMSMAGHPRRGT